MGESKQTNTGRLCPVYCPGFGAYTTSTSLPVVWTLAAYEGLKKPA